MNIPPLCFVRFARPAPIIQRGIFWYSVYRHLRLLVSPALLGDLECFINSMLQLFLMEALYKNLPSSLIKLPPVPPQPTIIILYLMPLTFLQKYPLMPLHRICLRHLLEAHTQAYACPDFQTPYTAVCLSRLHYLRSKKRLNTFRGYGYP